MRPVSALGTVAWPQLGHPSKLKMVTTGWEDGRGLIEDFGSLAHLQRNQAGAVFTASAEDLGTPPEVSGPMLV